MIVNNKTIPECMIGSEIWFDIGRLIHCLSKGSNEGYKLLLMFSKLDTENYKEHYCFDIWSDFNQDQNSELPEGW